MSERNDAILRKIRGLLAKAEDNKNEEEAQTSFILAQRLMIKHDIAMEDVSEGNNSPSREVADDNVTVHKTLYWWERQLGSIISENFRVKMYYNSKPNKSGRKVMSIRFLGLKDDIKLAREMYILAYDVLQFYAKRYVDKYFEDVYYRDRSESNEVKKSYMLGFLNGLREKFVEQQRELENEFGLMVLTPKEVEDKYNEMFEGSKGGVTTRIPRLKNYNAYASGFDDGKSVDYRRATIDDSIVD